MHKITAVRTEQLPGSSQPHVSQVKLGDGTVETSSQVIRWIREHELSYVISASGLPAAQVIVTGCPNCGEQVTTARSAREGNLLLALPGF